MLRSHITIARFPAVRSLRSAHAGRLGGRPTAVRLEGSDAPRGSFFPTSPA